MLPNEPPPVALGSLYAAVITKTTGGAVSRSIAPPGCAAMARFSLSTWTMSVSSQRPDTFSFCAALPASVPTRTNRPLTELSIRLLWWISGPIRE